jgi:hypothetical protein
MGRYEDRRSQQTVQGQSIGCHGIQNRRHQFRVFMCVLEPTDRTVSSGSDTSAETNGACVSGSGDYFQQIVAENTNASAQTLWELMKGRLYKAVKSQRARFTSATMKKDGTVEEIPERLRQLACGLPETTTDYVLLLRLRDGLPSALQVNELALTGEFDTVVSQVGQISDAMAALRPRREQANAVGGAGDYTNGNRNGTSHTIGRSDEEWTRDRTKPRRSSENPVGFNPNDPEDVRRWNRARQCYRCQQWGHIRISGTQECRWLEANPKNGADGGRGGRPSKSNRNGWREGGRE